MPKHRSRLLCSLLFIFSQLSSNYPCRGQVVLVNDVPSAFMAIEKTRVIHLRSNHLKVPSGGHLQGIQCIADSLIIITASSGSFSYYLSATLDAHSGMGQAKSLQKIADSPLKHAGGFQIYDHKMMVGLEDNESKNRSDIMMISFNDSLKETGKRVIAHRQGTVKRSTAGAVGFTKTITGQYMVVVGDWDSRNMDFYISRPRCDSSFDFLATFHADRNQKWCSYQSINLITDTAGNIYLIGFGLYGFYNRADLFKLEYHKDGASLILCASRNFKCKNGVGFRYGTGIGMINANGFNIYTCGRKLNPTSAINIFNR